MGYGGGVFMDGAFNGTGIYDLNGVVAHMGGAK